MEPKKNPKVDLRRKSFLFFNIGLITALLLAIFAFSFKATDHGPKIDADKTMLIIDDIPLVPVTTIETPPPPRQVIPVFIEVKNEDDIDPDPQIEVQLDDLEDIEIPIAPVITVEPEETNEPYLFVQESAAPVGGMQEYLRFISKNLKYPAKAQRMGIEGRVHVGFIVERDGSLSDVHVINKIGGGCDEEALRVVMLSKWTPGKQRGKPVRQKMVFPINFKLR